MIFTNACSAIPSITYRSDIFEIVREIPLVEVIERYSPNPLIIRHGKPKMLCPFHSEKTPSLSVKGQHWKCFGGCGKGGDGPDFVAELYGLGRVEAARIIAKDSGLLVDVDKPLTPEQLKEIQRRNERRKLERLWVHGTDAVFRMACEMQNAILAVTTPEDADGEIIETLAQLGNLLDALMYGKFDDIMHVLNGGWYYGHAG
ncbi:MAG: CHC2 zinc finger domain-containing protein [Desulfitobacteriaceae bacterium]